MNDVNFSNPAETISTAAAAIASRSLQQSVTGLKDGMARATDGVEKTQVKLKETTNTLVRQTDEIASYGQGNVEALIASSQIWATGVQDLSRQLAVTLQATAQRTMNMVKTLGTVKSPREAIELQTRFAYASAEKALSENELLVQASLKLSRQVLAPLTDRVRITGETFGNTR